MAETQYERMINIPWIYATRPELRDGLSMNTEYFELILK